MVVAHCQALSECQVILAIIGIHVVVIFCVFFPDISCLYGMETCRVLQEKCLHLCYLKNTLVVAFHILIPCQSSTLFDRIRNHINIDNMITDFSHELCQDAFVNTREHLGAYQVIQWYLFESFSENKLFFHISQNFDKFLSIISCNPLRYEIIAPRLMWCGNKAIESWQIFHTERSGRCCKKDVRHQFLDGRIFSFKVSGRLFYKCPERCLSLIVHKAPEYLVELHIDSTCDDSFYNAIRLSIIGSTDSSHNGKMHLWWCTDSFIELCERCSSGLCPEELLIDLYQSTEVRSGRKVNIIHPDRNQVGPELFTVNFNIQKPVVFLWFIGYWAVNQIIAGGIIYI